MTIALTTVQIREAAQRLRGYVRQTPVLEVDGDDFGLPGVTPRAQAGISPARRIVQDAWCASPICSRARFPQPVSSRRPAAIMAARLLMPRDAWESRQRFSCPASVRRASGS